MSDADRAGSSDDRTVIRSQSGDRPQPNLADRVMGRLGGPAPKQGAPKQGAPKQGAPKSSATPSRPPADSRPAPRGPEPTRNVDLLRQNEQRQNEQRQNEQRQAEQHRRPAENRVSPIPGPPVEHEPTQRVATRVEPTGSAVSAVPAPPASSSSAAAEPTGVTRAADVLKGKTSSTRRTRKARLRLASVDPWSVMKMAVLFSIAWGIASIVAVSALWFVIGQSGLFASINEMANSLFSAPGDATPFDLSQYITGGRVIGATVILAVIDVALLSALATIGAFLYNTGAVLLGGFEVTLADD